MIRTRPSDPIQGPDRPFPLPYPPTGPSLTGWPDPMPRPGDPPFPPPPPRIAYRAGKPPRLPRRERARRVLRQLGRYALGWAVVAWSCYWLGDVHLLVPGFVIAAMACNPWRPKRPARPVRPGSARVVHSGVVTSAGPLSLG